MPGDDRESLERRVAAVERALGDGETDRRPADVPTTDHRPADVPTTENGDRPPAADPAHLERRVGDLEARVDRLADRHDDVIDRLDGLDAHLQAVRGFLGGVDAVNESVERRADIAVAAVDRLEAQFGDRDASQFDQESHLDRASLTAPRTGDPDGPPEADGGTRRAPTGSDDAETSLRERLRSLR